MSKKRTFTLFFPVDSIEEANNASKAVFDWTSTNEKEDKDYLWELYLDRSKCDDRYKHCSEIIDEVSCITERSLTESRTRGMSQLTDVVVDIIPDKNSYILSVKLKFKKRK